MYHTDICNVKSVRSSVRGRGHELTSDLFSSKDHPSIVDEAVMVQLRWSNQKELWTYISTFKPALGKI